METDNCDPNETAVSTSLIEFFQIDDIEGSDVQVFDYSAEFLDSENICFSFDFQAHQGMNVSVWGIPSMEEGWNELFLRSEKATGGVESYTVSIGKEIIDELEGVYFGCYNEGDAYMYGTYLIKNDLKIDGVPKSMEEVLRYRTDGQITIYEATAQLLDNGYVRYNIDFSASKGRLISFFDPPNGNRFMRIRYSETTGERETIVVDIKQEDNNAISTITMNFYEGNKNSAWVFINTVHF